MLCVSMAYAEASLASIPSSQHSGASLASIPSSARPEANMSSTSAFLKPGRVSVAYPTNTARYSTTASTQMMSYSPLNAASTKRKYVRSASFGMSGGGVSLPAIAITNRNLENNSSVSASSSVPSQRRSGRDEPDNPADPPGMDTPLGDAPWLLMLLMLVGYVLFRYRRSAKN